MRSFRFIVYCCSHLCSFNYMAPPSFGKISIRGLPSPMTSRRCWKRSQHFDGISISSSSSLDLKGSIKKSGNQSNNLSPKLIGATNFERRKINHVDLPCLLKFVAKLIFLEFLRKDSIWGSQSSREKWAVERKKKNPVEGTAPQFCPLFSLVWPLNAPQK